MLLLAAAAIASRSLVTSNVSGSASLLGIIAVHLASPELLLLVRT
jgi:hypothetical protein